MARHEADREDLLREARALVDRVELELPGYAEPVVIGFRKDGCISVYFGADPAFHFNSAGQLRRGFREGRLLKAESGRLIELTRRRTSEQVELLRREWSEQETGQLVADLSGRLDDVRRLLLNRHYRVLGVVSESDNLLDRVLAWLESPGGAIEIARRPNVE